MSESFWKKEIRLRKARAEQPKAEQVEQAPEPKPAKEKSRALGRKREPLPAFPSHLLDKQRAPIDRPRGTVVVPVVPDRKQDDAVQQLERWSARIPAPAPKPEFPRTPSFEAEQPPSLLPKPPLPEPTPIFEAPPAPLPEAVTPEPTYGWSREPEPEPERTWSFASPEPAPEPEQVSDTVPVSDTSAVDPAPAWSFASAEPEPTVEAAEEPAPVDPAPAWSFTSPEPELTVEPLDEPAPEPVSDTLPVSDTTLDGPAPVEPDTLVVERAAEKVPLLKRELSFKRKPKAAKAPKPSEEKKAKQPAQPAVEKAPLLKRELSLKRKPKEPKAEKAPRAKRELRIPKPALKRSGGGDHKITNVVGLRIGSTQISAAQIQNNGTHELVQFARTPIDRGLVVGGEVRDADTLTRALKEFFADNKLPKKDVRLGIASNRIGVRVLDVPALDDHKAFENAIRFRAQELLPIPVTDAILDHVVLGDIQGEEGGVLRRVLLVFAHRELVTRFVDVCRGAGVRLSGIDLDAFALLRAIGRTETDGDTPRAIVAVGIGHERTVLAVSDGDVCDFTRVLEWGGSAIDVTVARALNLTPSQAEPVKQMLDLDSDTAPDGLSPVQFEAAKSAARAEIGALGRELVSSLRFYQSRPDSLPLGEVLLAGGGAQLGGLPEELNRLLGVPVRVVDPLAHVTLGKKVNPPENTASLAIAVGLGIEV